MKKTRKMEDQVAWVSYRIQRCRRCQRAGTRNTAVPGEGSLETKILLLGEAPGKKEDRTGRPFVGRAGKYLDDVFHSFSVRRDAVFVTSILKCFHPNSPKKPQIEACRPWTEEQIKILEPALILVMGRSAECGLFGNSRAQGDPVSEWHGIPCVVTCHPAAAMRFPQRRRQFERDFGRFIRKAKERKMLDD